MHQRTFLAKVSADATGAAFVELGKEDSRHLAQVLRAKKGDRLQVLVEEAKAGVDVAGLYKAEIESLSPVVKLKLLELSNHEAHFSHVSVSNLAFPISKQPILELVCEKVAELGAKRLILWGSERGELKELSPVKIARLERVAASALKQGAKSFKMNIIQ